MTKQQKKFWMTTLPKFILREQGRGFAMNVWREESEFTNGISHADRITRPFPSCGTIACIGGSIEVLGFDIDETGLTESQQIVLFYRWNSSTSNSWPQPFRKRYAQAKTPLAKAKVAAALCKLVGKTGGKCLDRHT